SALLLRPSSGTETVAGRRFGRPASFGRLFRGPDRTRLRDPGEILAAIAEQIAQDLLGMLAEERAALHLDRAVAQLDRQADGQILAPLRVIDLDNRAGPAQPFILGDLLHREDRPDGNIERIADLHDF